MTPQITPVTFRNPQGHQLFGMLHLPERPRADRPAVLLLSPGVKMRVAPHRMYVKMAERFVALGYTVFRFDFHGLGDAEGEATETYLADLYGATQAGRYVGDTIAAMDWMQHVHGISRFVAAGLCGGALTGLLAAERDARITGLMALSIPVIVDGTNIDATKFMTAAQLEGIGSGYLHKLKVSHADSWQSWVRLLTFQSEYRLILRSVFRPLWTRLRGAAPVARVEAAPEQPADNTNSLFAPAFWRMVSTSRRVLLVFAEADRLYAEFEEKFMSRHAASLEPFRPFFEVHVTAQANHIFSMQEWHADMLQRCCAWLEAPARERAVDAVAAATY
jgi:alpha/beta superfamily hydrolase